MHFDNVQWAADTLSHWRYALRLPILPADLLPKRTFKRVAKALKALWPGSTSISLSTAYELISVGIGYRDYHDVVRSSRKDMASLYIPSINEVRTNIALTIINKLNKPAIEIENLTSQLPIENFSAFNNLRCDDSASSGERASAQPPLPKHPANSENLRNEKFTVIPHSLPHSLSVFSKDELLSVERWMVRSDNLRDHCIFTLILGGLRRSEITTCRVGIPLIYEPSKSSNVSAQVELNEASLDLLKHYIDQNDLNGGEYLLQSSSTKKAPMTLSELDKIVTGWAKYISFKRMAVTITSIRTSIKSIANDSQIIKKKSP